MLFEYIFGFFAKPVWSNYLSGVNSEKVWFLAIELMSKKDKIGVKILPKVCSLVIYLMWGTDYS